MLPHWTRSGLGFTLVILVFFTIFQFITEENMHLFVAENASLSPATDRTFDIDHLLLLQNWQEKSQSIVDKMEPFSKPRKDSPFVFFHNRKCGGSSIRKIIFEACKKVNISKC